MKSLSDIDTPNTNVTTAIGNKSSIIVFAIAIVVLIILFFAVKSYRDLSGEKIVIDDVGDIVKAKETINVNIQGLEQDKEILRSLVST